jgi:hypothetical protein
LAPLPSSLVKDDLHPFESGKILSEIPPQDRLISRHKKKKPTPRHLTLASQATFQAGDRGVHSLSRRNERWPPPSVQESRHSTLPGQFGAEEQQLRSDAKQNNDVHGEKEACPYDEVPVLILGKKP